jgi:hypothetical protein
MISFSNLFADNDDKDYGLSTKINTFAKKTEIFDKDECYPLEESYKRFVFEARYLILTGEHRYIKRYFEKHLVCWNDKDIYNEFAQYYESQQQLYLAEIQYKKAGNIEKYKEMEQKRKTNNNTYSVEGGFRERYLKSLKKYKIRKASGAIMISVGSLAFASGLGLFIHDKAGGENSLSAQYSLMLGGLSLITGGIAVDMSGNHAKNFYDVGLEYAGNDNTLPKEFYYNSGAQSKVRKLSAKSFKQHGIGLIVMSIPMFTIAAYGFYDSYNHFKGGSGSGIDILISHFYQILTLVPPMLSLIFGSIMFVKASKWEKLSTKPQKITVNNIAPIINPITKTYGVFMGFSF